jgi:hypothetical protein
MNPRHAAALVLDSSSPEQGQRGCPDAGRQRVEAVHAVQAADVADGALAVACGLLNGVAQGPELGRVANHDAVVVLLLKGLVRSHRSRNSE